MPDTSSTEQTVSTTDVASLYQELESAERTADVLEGRLESLEKRLDELLAALEAKENQEVDGKE
jgi:hypothetical protein